MTKNTAKGAKQERKITFKNREHEKFYNTYLSKCRYPDYCYYVEWEAMFYAEN